MGVPIFIVERGGVKVFATERGGLKNSWCIRTIPGFTPQITSLNTDHSIISKPFSNLLQQTKTRKEKLIVKVINNFPTKTIFHFPFQTIVFRKFIKQTKI